MTGSRINPQHNEVDESIPHGESEAGVEVGVKNIFLHPNYTSLHTLHHDIALIELSQSVMYAPLVRPVCLPHGRSTTFSDLIFR